MVNDGEIPLVLSKIEIINMKNSSYDECLKEEVKCQSAENSNKGEKKKLSK